MSTEYTHFSRLAFDKLFAKGLDGQEVVVINSSGVFVGGVAITGSISVRSITTASNATFSGQVLLANGTAAAPSGSFVNEPSTGFFRPGTGAFAVSVLNAIRARFSTAGLQITGALDASSISSSIVTFAGQILLPNGSAAAPSMSFTNEPSTGFYRSGSKSFLASVSNANIIQFSTAGIAVTGVIASSNGAVSAPGITFSNELTSGLYRIGAGSIALAVKGAKILSLSTATVAITKTLTASNLSGTNTGDVTIGTANGLSLGGGGQALSMAAAASGTIGVVTAASQSFGGDKTFKGRIAVAGGSIGSGFAANIGGVGFTTGSNQGSINANLTASAAATASAIGVTANVTTAASTAACAYRIGYYSSNLTKGAGSTITRDYSYFIETPTQGTTANCSITDSFTVPGNFFIYSTTTNPSLLSGYLQVSNQADPGAVTDGVRIGSVDLSAGNATLSLRTETAVVSEVVISDRTLSVQINGTTYKICLKV